MLKRWGICGLALLALGLTARADTIRLVSGRQYHGAVVEWGDKQVSFVLDGGSLSDLFVIPTELIAVVVLPDGTERVPGTASWISSGRLDRLPWERKEPAPVKPRPGALVGKPGDLLSMKHYSLRLSPVGRRETGHTTYQIVFPWDPYYGNSRLDFPLDGFGAGVKVSALSRPIGTNGWQLGIDLELVKSLTDPKQDMTDSDWVSANSSGSTSQGDYRLVFSATTSASRSSNWDLTACARIMAPMSSGLKIGGLLGYQYLHLYSDIYGITGWQDTTLNNDIVYFDNLHDTRVLQYTISYKLPMLGLALRAESSEDLSLRAQGAYLFWAAAADEDLHLLRNKRSTCSASGGGWRLDCEAAVQLATLRNQGKIEMGCNYQYLKVDTEGGQTQTYYGDDPGFDGDQTGLSSSGISDKLFIRRHSFGIFLNYTF